MAGLHLKLACPPPNTAEDRLAAVQLGKGKGFWELAGTMGGVLPRKQPSIKPRTGWDYKSQEDEELHENTHEREYHAQGILTRYVRGDQRLGC